MSTQSNPVNWFEIPVADLARAKGFYQTAFGVEITDVEMPPNKMGWFPMERNAPGAAGTLMMGEHFKPSQEGTLVYFSVEQIDSTLGSIQKAGGEVLLPRTSIGEHGFIAHFVDSEGNRVALHEAPASAS